MTDSETANTGVSPIDAVITWVDGSDKAHKEKMNAYVKSNGQNIQGAHPTRFSSFNEIQYCISSIFKFAPFVRKVFIVTDNQKPPVYDHIAKYFPDRLEDVKTVDHKVIFKGYEKHLPVFNSDAIESMLWRIPGLSNHFVCFNDDFFIIRKINPNEWFNEGQPVMRGGWHFTPYRKMFSNKIKTIINKHIRGNKSFQPRFSFYLRQYIAASALGFRYRFFYHSHNPYPLNKKNLQKFYTENEKMLVSNISHRFRSSQQFVTISLAYHAEIFNGNRNQARRYHVYLDPYHDSEKKIQRKLDFADKKSNIKVLCAQSLDMTTPAIRQMIFRWLGKKLALGKI